MERKRSCEIVSLLKKLWKRSSSEKAASMKSKVFLKIATLKKQLSRKSRQCRILLFRKITFFQKVILWKSCGEVATWFKKLLLLKMSLYIEYYLTRVNISISNKNRPGLFVLLFTPSTKPWVNNANKAK